MVACRYPHPVSKKPPQDPTSLPFEDALAQIEAIIEKIESGEAGLEQSIADYERGVKLVNHCRATLDKARRHVEDLTRKLEQADNSPSPPSPAAGSASRDGTLSSAADHDEDPDEAPF